MKIVTFETQNPNASTDKKYRIGALISENEILDLSPLVSKKNLTAADILKCLNMDNGYIQEFKTVIAAADKANFAILNPRFVKAAAPVPRPGKIICVGLNYRDHAAESNQPIPQSPIIFSKFSTCVIGAGEPVLLPKNSSQVDYEAELAVVIGRSAKNVKREHALEYVLGYTNFNDVSARDFQFADGQWQRGKSCDTFAPMGAFIVTADEIPEPHKLKICFRLNGETLQNSNTSELIFDIPHLIEFLSETITLEAGDIIATGTPPGVGFARKPPVFLKDGDVAEVEIEHLGVLSNPIVAAE